MDWRAISTVVAVIAVLGVSEAAANGPRVITKCQTLDAPGSYTLGKSLTAGGDCLIVAADFVTVDLDGQVLTGNGTGAGITDHGSARLGIAVRNGTITGFLEGIDLGFSLTQIDRVRAVKNGDNGIYAGPGSSVTGSTAFHNNGIGIMAQGQNLVTGNVVIGNSIGIVVQCPNNVIGNISKGNFSPGTAIELNYQTIGPPSAVCNSVNNVF